jgi:DnaJ-class molecular chaperone
MERSIFKSFLDKVKYMFSSEEPVFDEKIHKPCPDCNGCGSEDFGACLDCDGKGFIDKTYQERHNLDPYKNEI